MRAAAPGKATAAGEPDATRPRVHMVANAHLDPVWIWDWHEGMHEVLQTFRAALDHLAGCDGLVFCASSAAYYRWVAEVDPGLLARVRAAVEAGRWVVTGGQWVEPDCNLPSGESVCRQLLYGQRTLVELLGRPATVGWNVDSFGHGAGLPPLLAHGGLVAYVMMRPAAHELDLPGHAFWWQGADGTGLPCYRIPFDYSTRGDEAALVRQRAGALLAEDAPVPLMCFYGVGDHGGGPTRRALAAVSELAAETDGAVAFGDPETYFAQLAGAGPLPVVEGELQHHAVGCYSAMAPVKRANAEAERALGRAETMAAMARSLVGHDRGATGELAAAWEPVLFNQFHDTLGGTCTATALAGLEPGWGQARAVADRVTTLAAHAVCERLDTWTDGAEAAEGIESAVGGLPVPVVVFNPTGAPVRGPVTLIHPLAAARDDEGRPVAVQRVASGEVTYSPTGTLFVAEVPPLGYRRYWLSVAADGEGPTGDLVTGEGTLANGALRLAADASGSALVELEALGHQWLGPGGLRPVVLEDPSDTWSHGVARYDGDEVPLEPEGARVVETGPVRASLVLAYRLGRSRVVVAARLWAGLDALELEVDVDWHEHQRVLKLEVPVDLAAARAVAGAAYGHVERPAAGTEEAMAHWVDVAGRLGGDGPEGGLGVTTDAVQGYDLAGPRLRCTLVRSPRYADHGWGWATDDAAFGFTDQGRHRFSLRLHPHRADWAAADLPGRLRDHVAELPVVLDTWHRGPLGPVASLGRVEAGTATLAVVKRAERAEGWVVRVWEHAGAPTRARVALDLCGRVWEGELGPHELRTLYLPDNHAAPLQAVDVCELELEGR